MKYGSGYSVGNEVLYRFRSGMFFHLRGDDYYHGRDVGSNQVKAFELWSKGADLGDVQCMINLSWAYAEGIGIEKSAEKAAEWGKKAKEAQEAHGVAVEALEEKRAECRARTKVFPCDIEVGTDDFVLITQYYQDSSPMRQAEIDLTLKLNIANPLIKKIVLFMEEDYDFHFRTDKIERVVINDRMHYGDAFSHMRGKPGIKVVANSDIFFDESLALFVDMRLEGKMYVMTRKDLEYDRFEMSMAKPAFMGPVNPTWSHDVWVYRDLPEFKDGYYLGVWGCETLMVAEAMKAGVDVANMFNYVNAIHVHWAPKRNWTDGTLPYLEVFSGFDFVCSGVRLVWDLVQEKDARKSS